MPPKKNNYIDKIRAEFIREFNNARKRMDAESKQTPIKNVASELVNDFTICQN